MASSNSNAAYNLSSFHTPPERQAAPELKVVKSAHRVRSIIFTPKAVCAFAIIITMITMIVYNQVQLNEVSGDINKLNAQLQELQSESVKMTSELESTISLRSISEQAKNELGMNKLDKYQTEYIYLFQEDKIELTEESPAQSFGERVQLTVTSAIERLKEYIAG